MPASIYRSLRGFLPVLELIIGAWAATTAALAGALGLWGTAIFHGLFALGLLWLGGLCVVEGLRRPAMGSAHDLAADPG